MRLARRIFIALIAATCAEAAPSIPGLEQRTLQQPETRIDHLELEACLAEATQIEMQSQTATLIDKDSSGRPVIPELLADNKSTQFIKHGSDLAVRESQAVFHRCLQRQLNNR